MLCPFCGEDDKASKKLWAREAARREDEVKKKMEG